MGFLAPAIPAIGGLIGGLLGGGGGGKAQPPASGQIGNAYATLQSNLNNTQAQGQNLLNISNASLMPALNYYGSILSGNPSAVGQALSPELTSLRSGYQSARNQLNTFAPMGGGRADALAAAPYQLAGQTSNLISQARNAAGQNLAQLGQGTAGLANNFYGTSNNSAATLLGQLYPQQQVGMQQGGLLGGGISNILQGINWNNVFGGGGGGAGSYGSGAGLNPGGFVP